MAETVEELRNLSEDSLIRRHDKKAKQTMVGTAHYLQELERRDHLSINKSMLKYTRYIFWFTVAVTVFTMINVLSFTIR